MEYFDFDQAAQQDDTASDCVELGGQDFDQFFADDSNQNLTLPEINDAGHSLEDGKPLTSSMHRAKEACYFCRSMGLDCFVAQRGVMQNGCTCCVALYRECSFTHAPPPGKYIHTLHVVSEDAYVPTGGLTGKRVLKSFGGTNSGAHNEETDQKARKTGARFSLKTVKILKSWLSEHKTNPYPTDEEKNDLTIKTGLKQSQISGWLANARRRGKVQPPTPPPSDSSSVTGAVPIPGKRLPAGVDYSELNPLDRWRHSPPENEAASARDIIQAMATTSFTAEKNNQRRKGPGSHSKNTGSSNDDSYSNQINTKSLSSFSLDTTKSSVSEMSFASAFSHRSSRGSWNSGETRERRRRRHKTAAIQKSLKKSRSARIFQCTFCTDSFATKYDWQRHEKSLHLALDKWICAPEGAVLSTADGRITCAFCHHPDPDEDHLETHNYSACQEKVLQERTFYRKDHLNQHLRLMHNVKFNSWMDAWKSTTTEIKSRCGFCSIHFTTWKDRVDHLAAHYKTGTEISQWRGDWGFEPLVQQHVENATPPYMIGHERETTDPWVASKLPGLGNPSKGKAPGEEVSTRSSLKIPVPRDASCFRRLETELSSYIGRLIAQGIIPTDKMIQTEARIVVYGNDDPWNQTCADNPIWLTVLKRDIGLCDIPHANNFHLTDLGMQPPFAVDGGLLRAPMHTAKTAPPISSPIPGGSGFQSVATSHRGSLAGSVTGSFDVSSTGSGIGLGGEYMQEGTHSNFFPPNNFRNMHSNPSLPVPTPAAATTTTPNAITTREVDPLFELGFDEDFLQRLNDGYGDLSNTIDSIEQDGFESRSTAALNSVGSFSSYDNNGSQYNFTTTSESASASASTPMTPFSGTMIPSSAPTTVSGSFVPSYQNSFKSSDMALDEEYWNSRA